MPGLKRKHYNNLSWYDEQRLSFGKKAVASFMLLGVVFAAHYYFNVSPHNEQPGLSVDLGTYLASVAIFLSIFTILSINLPILLLDGGYGKISTVEYEIKQAEDGLKNIKESINLFYLPLSALFIIPDNEENFQARAQKIAEINCNKHLAEPRVRAIFERYIEGEKEPNLQELVNRDIKDLQKKYIELKGELEG